MPQRKLQSYTVEQTVNNLRRLFQAVNEQSKHAVHDSGLNGPQLWALKVLAEETDQKLTVSSLARRMCLNSSTVVRLLDGLELKGFVQRERSSHDRRIVHINLTETGVALIRQSPEVAQDILANGLRSLSENRLQSIASSLSKLVSIIESHRFLT